MPFYTPLHCLPGCTFCIYFCHLPYTHHLLLFFLYTLHWALHTPPTYLPLPADCCTILPGTFKLYHLPATIITDMHLHCTQEVTVLPLPPFQAAVCLYLHHLSCVIHAHHLHTHHHTPFSQHLFAETFHFTIQVSFLIPFTTVYHGTTYLAHCCGI